MKPPRDPHQDACREGSRGPSQETLDEIIDRVASDLTQVPSDTAFSARVQRRLDNVHRLPLWLTATAVTASLIAAVAIGLSVERSRRNNQVFVAPSRDEAQAVSVSKVEEPSVVVAAITESAIRVMPVFESEPATSIPALASPHRLHVEDLVLDPLTLDQVADPGVLEVTALDIREIDASPNPKE